VTTAASPLICIISHSCLVPHKPPGATVRKSVGFTRRLDHAPT
jgi:hypothetical protein